MKQPSNSMRVAIHLTIMVAMTFLSLCALAGDKTISSHVKRVVLFQGQAQVTRETTVDLKAGNNRLIFSGVSPYFNPGSIQVSTDESVNIASVTSEASTEEPFITDEIEQLKDSVQSIDDLLNTIKGKREGLNAEREVMMANKQIGGSNTVLHADDLEETMALYRKRFQEISDELYRLLKSEKPLTENRKKLQSRIDEYMQSVMNKTDLVIAVDAPEAKNNVHIEFSYTVTNCSWTPYYDIRIADTKSPLKLISRANITQQTAEDWNNIELILSTANPSDRSAMQELQVNRIDFLQAVMLEDMGRPASAPAPGMMKMLYSATNAVVVQQQTHIEFVIKAKTTVASDNKPHQVDLTTDEIPAIYAYGTVPKLDASVYATAQIPATDLANQMPGDAHIYFDGTYTGDTYLQGTAEDSMNISLGKDSRLHVERTLVKENSSKTCFGGTKIDQKTWKIAVKNTRKEPVEILIKDQIPVSSNSEIEVKLLNQGGATHEAETGILTWRLKLAPEQSTTVEFSFEVRHPKNKSVTPY